MVCSTRALTNLVATEQREQSVRQPVDGWVDFVKGAR